MTARAEPFAKHLDRLDAEAAAPDWRATVDRLARLPPIEYDRCREAEAAALGCLVSTLDKEVRNARGEGASDTQGQPIEYPEVEPWPEPVAGAGLLEELTAALRRYVVLPEHGAEACALWAVMTWVAPDLDCLPLLRIVSPTKQCGKTTLLDVLSELVYRPLPASGISPAALFRIIESHNPTLLLDEVDTFMKQSEDHRGILNAGHTRAAARVIRTVGEEHEPRAFNVFGPKLLAGIGSLPGTIEDRAVRIELRRRAPGETVASLRQDGRAQFDGLRQRIRRWTDDKREAIRRGAAHAVLPDGLPDRAKDNWASLVAIADLAGPECGERARRAALALTETDATAERSVMLLADLRDLFEARDVDRLPTADILEHLGNLEERPWVDCCRGKPITARQLSRWLGEFKVKSGNIRLDNGRTPKGYRLADLAEPFARYLPPRAAATPPQPISRAVFSGIGSATPPEAVADRNGLEVPSLLTCGGVADKSPVGPEVERSGGPAPGSADWYAEEWRRQETARLAAEKP